MGDRVADRTETRSLRTLLTALFLVAHEKYAQLTGDTHLLTEQLANVLAAVAYIERHLHDAIMDVLGF
jgi:glycogen debranching enzyme